MDHIQIDTQTKNGHASTDTRQVAVMKADAEPIQDPSHFAHIWQMFGYAVLDVGGTNVGPVARIWTDNSSGTLAFVGVNTGWLKHQTHVIPVAGARIDDTNRLISVGYSGELIRGAPCHNTDVSLTGDRERKVDSHYDSN